MSSAVSSQESFRNGPRDNPARRLGLLLSAIACLLGLGLTGLVPAQAAPGDPAAAPSVPSRAGRPPGWAVQPAGPGRWEVSWTGTSTFPVVSDRPTVVDDDGAPVGTPTVSRDGRTVQVVVTAAKRPKTAGLRVVLSGARLDRPGQGGSPSRRSATPRLAAQSADPSGPGPRLATDPGAAGPYAVVSSDYTLPSLTVPGLDEPIEMVGHTVEPAAGAVTGPRPLVLFLHGRHEYCYQVRKGESNDGWPCRGTMTEVPSHLGYDYAQRLLASQGYATVSVRVNGINAQDFVLDDGGADARARVVIAHLDHWVSIAGAHQVDLRRVVLVGHSRGGEGVDRAALRIPLSAPYRVVGQVLLAPTDFGYQTAPYVPTVTVLPYCDGDVSDLQGQRFTDTSRDLDAADTSLKSSVLVMGANHNFFNTEWTPGTAAAPADDDWYGDPKKTCGTKTAARLTAGQQRQVGQAYVSAAVHQFTAPVGAPQPYLPLLDGSGASVASTGQAVVHSHAIGGGRDLRRPSTGTSLTLAEGASSSFCSGAVSEDYRPDLCGSELLDLTAPHWSYREEGVPTRKFWHVGWTAKGQTAGLELKQPLDLRSRTLDLRAIVDPRLGDVKVRVRLTDTTGHATTLAPVGGRTVRALPSRDGVAKLWAQTVRVDPAKAAGTLDLRRVDRVEIIGDSADGGLWVADLGAAPTTLPAVPDRRAPALSIGTLTVREGNRPGTSTAQLPYTLSAPMAGPGRVKVLVVGGNLRSPRHLTLDLARGQDHGAIPVGYTADRLDSPDQTAIGAVAYATHGLMTDLYTGTVVVTDDDPTPKVSVKRVKTRIAEGASARWKVTLAQPVGYDTSVEGIVVNGPGRDLTGADVPADWLLEHSFGEKKPKPSKTLAANDVAVGAYLEAGRRSVTLTIPTRRDGKKEKAEAVTLEVHALDTTRTSTIRVKASR